MGAKLKAFVRNIPPEQPATTRKAVHLDTHRVVRVRAKTIWFNKEYLAITISLQIGDSHKIASSPVVGEQRWLYCMSQAIGP
jgi:hypothetical protein